MVDLSELPGFLGVILVFLIPPGPDMAYMLAVGLEGGRRAGLKAILGIATGMSVYAPATALTPRSGRKSRITSACSCSRGRSWDE